MQRLRIMPEKLGSSDPQRGAMGDHPRIERTCSRRRAKSAWHAVRADHRRNGFACGLCVADGSVWRGRDDRHDARRMEAFHRRRDQSQTMDEARLRKMTANLVGEAHAEDVLRGYSKGTPFER
jgi:hypothetical protein